MPSSNYPSLAQVSLSLSLSLCLSPSHQLKSSVTPMLLPRLMIEIQIPCSGIQDWPRSNFNCFLRSRLLLFRFMHYTEEPSWITPSVPIKTLDSLPLCLLYWNILTHHWHLLKIDSFSEASLRVDFSMSFSITHRNNVYWVYISSVLITGNLILFT